MDISKNSVWRGLLAAALVAALLTRAQLAKAGSALETRLRSPVPDHANNTNSAAAVANCFLGWPTATQLVLGDGSTETIVSPMPDANAAFDGGFSPLPTTLVIGAVYIVLLITPRHLDRTPWFGFAHRTAVLGGMAVLLVCRLITAKYTGPVEMSLNVPTLHRETCAAAAADVAAVVAKTEAYHTGWTWFSVAATPTLFDAAISVLTLVGA